MRWSARSLLDFSYTPAINDAFEGTWAHGDPIDIHNLDESTHSPSNDGESDIEAPT